MTQPVETRAVERTGTFQLAGEASGQALVFSQPLSFWGGINAETGDILTETRMRMIRYVAGLGVDASPEAERLRKHQRLA